jgi:hypothetical protein
VDIDKRHDRSQVLPATTTCGHQPNVGGKARRGLRMQARALEPRIAASPRRADQERISQEMSGKSLVSPANAFAGR